MSGKSEKAVELYNAGCNCCQAVVAALGEEEGDSGELLRLASAFGGGMRKGEVCGAAAGALMAIGLRHGADGPPSTEQATAAKARTNALAKEYMEAFKERYGSYLCRELIKNAGGRVCDKLVPGAVALLEELENRRS